MNWDKLPENAIAEIMAFHGVRVTHREFRVGYYEFPRRRFLRIVKVNPNTIAYRHYDYGSLLLEQQLPKEFIK